MGHFLHRKEGATQGDPLAMITYGLGTLPFIRDLQTAHPGVTQSYYADDTGMDGTFSGIIEHLNDLIF